MRRRMLSTHVLSIGCHISLNYFLIINTQIRMSINFANDSNAEFLQLSGQSQVSS